MSRFRSERMIFLCAGGFCGIAPKALSFVAGIYMILLTNMYLIFEAGHLNRSLTLLKLQQSKHYITNLVWIMPYCYYTAIVLALLCYPVCIFFLYSVQKQHILGIVSYFAWIIFYDLANCVIVVLTSRAARAAVFSISPLEWFGAISRVVMDAFWLSFVITYAMMLVEGRSTGRTSLRPRRISKHVTEPPKSRLGITLRKIP
uniref:Transmembrane protein 217 n=1 Tax=Salvator merianae TaxID=96440 RepID=A0A8D0E615_SALMN